MPKTRWGWREFTYYERSNYNHIYDRLREIIMSAGPFDTVNAAVFRKVLDEALADGFLIDWPDESGEALLLFATNFECAIRAGVPQMLINAGADVNIKYFRTGSTALGNTCFCYVSSGERECLSVINALLTAGARLELDERWKKNCWRGLGQQARRDWLETYLLSWSERRAAQDRSEDAAPGFDYAL